MFMLLKLTTTKNDQPSRLINYKTDLFVNGVERMDFLYVIYILHRIFIKMMGIFVFASVHWQYS